MNSGWRIKEEPGKEKVGPTLREAPPPAEGKFGRLGANQDLYLRQCVRASGGSQNKRGGTETGCCRHSGNKNRERKERGCREGGKEEEEGSRGSQPACPNGCILPG